MEGWWSLQDITGLRVTMNPNAVQKKSHFAAEKNPAKLDMH